MVAGTDPVAELAVTIRHFRHFFPEMCYLALSRMRMQGKLLREPIEP